VKLRIVAMWQQKIDECGQRSGFSVFQFVQGCTAVGFFEIAAFYVGGEFETRNEVLHICHGVKVRKHPKGAA
jgi:hypothetical protein